MNDDMNNDFTEIPEPFSEVPQVIDVLPDGREVVVIGDPQGDAAFTHQQGDNSLGFQGTCGLCSCECVLRQFGFNVSEDFVVRYATENDLCESNSANPAENGGTTADMRAEILTNLGVPAHVEYAQSLEDLAVNLEEGRGVIAGLNAGILWDDPRAYEFGQSNHAVTVTGVMRDAANGHILGFYINDSGNGQAARFVDATTMQLAWLQPGGQTVVTDIVRQ